MSFTNQASSPLWTPNGRKVCYRNGIDVLCQGADGGQAETAVDGLNAVKSFSPDGARLLSIVTGKHANDATDIVMTTIGPPAATRPLIQTRFIESGPAISPDGKWVAYH